MGHVLYSFRRCPYAMRGRMGLFIAGIEYEHREVLLRDKPDAMLEASPKGTVPVFVKDDGEVIDESLDLLRWALSQNDPENWLEFGERDELIVWCDGDFKHNLDRYKYASRYEDVPRGAVNLDHRAKACEFLAALEVELSQHKYLRRDTPALADIAIFPFIRQFAAVERDWWAGHDYPKVGAWLAALIESDLFKAIMVKHDVWTPDA